MHMDRMSYYRNVLAALGVFLSASVCNAKVLTEAAIICAQKVTAEIDESKVLRVTVECASVDASGTLLRVLDKDITNRLTNAQISGILTIIGRIGAVTAESENIPTPASTPTPAVGTTPTTLITP